MAKITLIAFDQTVFSLSPLASIWFVDGDPDQQDPSELIRIWNQVTEQTHDPYTVDLQQHPLNILKAEVPGNDSDVLTLVIGREETGDHTQYTFSLQSDKGKEIATGKSPKLVVLNSNMQMAYRGVIERFSMAQGPLPKELEGMMYEEMEVAFERTKILFYQEALGDTIVADDNFYTYLAEAIRIADIENQTKTTYKRGVELVSDFDDPGGFPPPRVN